MKHCTVTATILALAMDAGAAAGAPTSKPPLLQLQFSPDGRYILARDKSEISILSVHPLSVLFRIPAEQADPPRFTPDSRELVLLSSGIKVDPQRITVRDAASHVERWSMMHRDVVESTTLPAMACGTQQLSPNGDVVVCLDLEGRLRLFDVGSGQTIFDEKKFEILLYNDPAPGTIGPRTTWGRLGDAHIDFSPDGRFAMVNAEWADAPVRIFDLHARRSIKPSGALKLLRDRWSAWIAPDRFLLDHGISSAKSNATRALRRAPSLRFLRGKCYPIRGSPTVGSIEPQTRWQKLVGV